MSTLFKKADRRKKKLRLALDGPAGSGKTLTALRFAMVLARHEAMKAGRPNQPRVAVIDTENGSASIYQGDVYDGYPIEFDVIELSEFSPTKYSEITREASRLGYDVLVIDSLSHAWSGKGGALELVDRAADKVKGNTFAGWKDITPLQTEMIETIIRSACHILVTMRTKTEWVLEINERGKQVPRKVGMAPVQRSGVEYEFDVVLDIDEDHIARVTKSRCSAIADKASSKPGAEFMGAVVSWLDHGSDIPQEVLDRAQLADVPSQNAAGAGVDGVANQPAALTDEERAARMAARKAALQSVNNAHTEVLKTISEHVVVPTQSPTLAENPTNEPQGTATGIQPASAAAPIATEAPAQAASAASPATAAPAATVTQAATQAPASDVPMSTPAQHLTINAMFGNLKLTPESPEYTEALRRRKATKIEELTHAAAENLISGLRSIIAGQAPKEPVAAVGTMATVATVAEVSPATDPKLITPIQTNDLRELFARCGVTTDVAVSIIGKRGVKTMAELTEVQAAEIIQALRGKLFAATQQQQKEEMAAVAGEAVEYCDDGVTPVPF